MTWDFAISSMDVECVGTGSSTGPCQYLSLSEVANVTCDGAYACKYLTVETVPALRCDGSYGLQYASVGTVGTLDCAGSSSSDTYCCANIKVDAVTEMSEFLCVGSYACSYGVFQSITALGGNGASKLLCDGTYACQYAQFHAIGDADTPLAIACDGTSSCYATQVQDMRGVNRSLTCSGSSACSYMTWEDISPSTVLECFGTGSSGPCTNLAVKEVASLTCDGANACNYLTVGSVADGEGDVECSGSTRSEEHTSELQSHV